MTNKFRCPYCNKSYARESWFRKHACEKRRRFEEAHKIEFLRAKRLYEHWRRRNGYLRKGKDITDAEFINSSFYNTFIKLSKFTSDNWVITSFKYLDYIIDMRITEPKWLSEETLKLYREFIRRHEDPVAQAKVTCESIKAWCLSNEIDRREFFAKITPGSALKMVVSNQISPWVLFGYDRSVNDLLTRVNDDWLFTIDEHLNNRYWIDKIKSSTDTRSVIQQECEKVLVGE